MEGRSEKAFEILGAVYDKISVKVIRDGKTVVIPKEELVAGDVAFIETGDKIVADGRLIESNGLKTDESMLTGESATFTSNGLPAFSATITAREAESRRSMRTGCENSMSKYM